jgi:hypothetical protein
VGPVRNKCDDVVKFKRQSWRFKLLLMAVPGHVWKGQNISALPLSSDIYLFGNIQCVINFNTEILHGAFDLSVTKQ